MDVAELGDLCGGVLGLGDGAVEREVGRALVALLNNALVVLLSDQVADLFIRKWSLAGSDRIDNLSRDFT